ncbi:MAG: BatA domain-containing protein [Planctomycetota bacterium]
MTVLHLLAFGFANAAILGWLAAAAAPILIHLWMKRVHRETPWAAVRFLQAAIKRHARRLRLQEWLLLAIRTTIILLVVLAASQPVLDSLGGLLGAGTRTHRVVVIDASLSMRMQADASDASGGTLLSRAKQTATEIVDQSSSSDQFSVCVMADPPRAVIAQPTVDSQAASRAIAGIEPTDGASNLEATLTLVDQLLTAAEQGGATADRREVVFLSDLTQTAWQALATQTEGQAGIVQQLFAKVTDRAAASVVDVGVAKPQNVAVTDVRVVSGTPTLRQSVFIAARVQAFGEQRQALAETPVELVVDGLAVDSKTVSLADAGSATVEFDHRFRRPGWRRVAVRALGDRLAADDTRRLAVEVKPHVAVLCVEGRRNAARYVADALNPTGERNAAVQVQTITDAELAATDLQSFDAVFLCNVAEFTSREASRLDQYVTGGGGVAFFLGDRVRADRYNAVLGQAIDGSQQAAAKPRLQTPFRFANAGQNRLPIRPIAERTEQPLLPVVVGDAVSQTNYGIDPLDYQHPITAPFRGRQRAGLLTTPIERFFRVRIPPAATTAEVVLATSAGDPLAVSSAVGSGRVVVFATAGSLASVDPATGRPWTVMPAWPSFVPIVRETLRYVAGASLELPAPIVGQAIGSRLPFSATTPLAIIRPDDSREQVAIDAEQAAWVYQRTDQAGFYSLAGEDANAVVDDSPAYLAAVNTPPAESDVTRIAESKLPAELAVRRAAAEPNTPDADLVRPVGIHRGLLLSAIGLVLLETWLAYWFGRGKA